MTQSFQINRRFLRLYGAAGIWAMLGGGMLTFTTGQKVFGSLLILVAVVLLYLLASGKILKERSYSGTDLFFMFLPVPGVILIAGIYFLIFPRSYLLLVYLVVFSLLSALALFQLRKTAK